MQGLRPLLALAAALALPAPAAAQQAPEPLVDLAPLSTRFADRVGPSPASTRAGGDSPWAAYVAPDGQRVRVRFAAGMEPDPAVAQSYVDFLGSLPHGSELRRLRMVIGGLADVRRRCGGHAGTLACYDPRANRMTVPGEQVADESDGVTTSYVVAHEYGHHVARWRDNRPFSALIVGPKRWASEELVCLHSLEGRLAPGDQGDRYLANPGEAWADTYAHLRYPEAGWQYARLLQPTPASYRAALLDVEDPWARGLQRTFRGSFAANGPDIRVFEIVLRLDGILRIALRGPRDAEMNLLLRSLGERQGVTRTPGARDVYSLRYACREVAAERLQIVVTRSEGAGPFLLDVSYAG